jgi:sortase A
MRDKRSVDELTLEELERVLAIRRREARQAQLARMKRDGRVVTASQPASAAPPAPKPTVDVPPGLTVDDEGVSPNGLREKPVSAPPQFEDEVHDVDVVARRRRDESERTWRRFVNVSLLLVEMAAVVALLALGFMLLSARDELQETTRTEQANANATRAAMIPTLEPTAVLRVDVNDWVLPGGHTIQNGQGVPNLAELEQAGIPTHLLPEVQQQLVQPVIERPPRTSETALSVSIPRLGLDGETITQGTDWEALTRGVGQVLNGARPGDETGNVVLAAHNDIYGELFRDLDQLEPGDRFTVRTETAEFTYVVRSTRIVEPHEVDVMDNQGIPMATLISCYPYGQNTHRYIVFAERLDS